MFVFDLVTKYIKHTPHIDIISDVTITFVIRKEDSLDRTYTHSIEFYKDGVLFDRATILLPNKPITIDKFNFVDLWAHLLLEGDSVVNSRRLNSGAKIIVPRNLGHQAIIIVSKDAKEEWCFVSPTPTAVEKLPRLPLVRKNGVRIVQTSWDTKDIWTNFGISKEQLCVELWNYDRDCLARYFCPLREVLTQEDIKRIHLNTPMGREVFDNLTEEWDEREKFRLLVRRFGPLLFMSSTDGELSAIASTETFTPKAIHVVKVIHDELKRTFDKRTSPMSPLSFKTAVMERLFALEASEFEVEQSLLNLCFSVVQRTSEE